MITLIFIWPVFLLKLWFLGFILYNIMIIFIPVKVFLIEILFFFTGDPVFLWDFKRKRGARIFPDSPQDVVALEISFISARASFPVELGLFDLA